MQYHYITGTSSGIGRAIADELLKDEQNIVYGISRRSAINHPNYFHSYLDLSSLEDALKVNFDEHEDAKKIILINNAATLGEVKYFGKLHNTEIDKAFTVNVIAVAILMNNFIKQYQHHEAEKIIINVTSGAANSAYDGWGIYCASKAAINMLSQVAVKEQESKNRSKIKVFAVAPGVVNTHMQSEIRNTEIGDFSRKEKFIELYEENELYDPNEVAKQFLRIIEKPESVNEIISRIEL